MKLIEALKICQKEICDSLEKSRARNGDDLTPEEIKKLKSDTVVYWINKAAILDTARPIFVSIRIPSGPIPVGKNADGKVAFRRVIAYISVVTLKGSTDPKLLNFLESMEKNFLVNGYSFEQNRDAELDSQSGRTIWPFQISKII
jgi:hypothetical protein